MRVHVNKNTYLVIGVRVREGKLWRMRVGEMGEKNKTRSDKTDKKDKFDLTEYHTEISFHVECI